MNRTSLAQFSLVTSILIALCLLDVACGGSSATQNLSAVDRFELGKKKFNDHDYLEAISDFEVVKLQFTGSAVADSAQYYLGECHFMREEFLLAAQEYQTLKRNMPASPLIPLAQYKIGLCYYMLSPKSSLDQTYTQRAIDELQAFIEYYPKHEMVKDAEEKIKELNTRLAKKLFDTAELYMKMEYYKSASIYYTAVIEKYHDTQYAEPALLGKVRSLMARRHYEEARPELDRFFERYPNSSRRAEAESLRDDLDNRLKTKSAGLGFPAPTLGSFDHA